MAINSDVDSQINVVAASQINADVEAVYTAAVNDALRLIDQLRARVNKHDDQDHNWGHVGEIAQVCQSLSDIVACFSRQ